MLMSESKYPAVFVFCLIALMLNGCAGGYLGFWKQQHELKKAFQDEPSADLLRQLDPQDCFLLGGRFAFTSDYKKPVLVVAVTDRFKKREIVAARILQPPVISIRPTFPKDAMIFIFLRTLMETDFSTPMK